MRRTLCKNPRFLCKNRKAASAVEMALILPLFFGVVLGIIEFGRAMMVSQLIVCAAREGARLAVIDGTTNAAVRQRARQFAADTLHIPTDSVAVAISITPGPGNPSPGNDVANATTGDMIDIYVAIPFDEVAFIAGDYLTGKTLHGEVSMRHE